MSSSAAKMSSGLQLYGYVGEKAKLGPIIPLGTNNLNDSIAFAFARLAI